jgi:hypothetical protein
LHPATIKAPRATTGSIFRVFFMAIDEVHPADPGIKKRWEGTQNKGHSSFDQIGQQLKSGPVLLGETALEA